MLEALTNVETRLRPLPSSLAPLPGERLSGFLLRVAYRLERSPSRIARITGLVPADARGAVVPFALEVNLSRAQRSTFAAAARLTEAEAEALCVSGFAGRYPAAVPGLGVWAASPAWSRRRSITGARWIYDGVVRWCPQCLAGDGTPVQNQLGGAWSKAWRLAVVFGCPRHQRLLEHLCPGCSRLLADTRGRMAVPYASRRDVHPASCRLPAPGFAGYRVDRSPVCGAALTVAPPLVLTDPALRLQRRILGLLDPGQPGATVSVGWPATAAQYFTDLELIAGLVRDSWPRITSMLDVPAALGELADRDRKRAVDCRLTRRIHSEPPPEAASSSALLTIADHLLSSEASDLAQHILHMLAFDPRRAGDIPWTRDFLDERPDCSPGFLRAITPAVQGYAPHHAGLRRQHRRAPVYPAGYGPAQIAQFLQDDWYQRYLAGMDGISVTLLRRTTALYLCQIAAGGTVAGAAELLGLPVQRVRGGIARVQHWARARPDIREFETALYALAEHLGHADGLIDYGRRRQALEGWSIGPGDWTRICARLDPCDPRASRLQLGDRLRQTASMIVWARATQGEHVFAPHPIRDQQPADIQASWRHFDYTAWCRIRKNRLRPFEAELWPILFAYADDVAARIDKGEPPRSNYPQSRVPD